MTNNRGYFANISRSS